MSGNPVASVFDAWSCTSSRAIDTLLETNRAVAAAWGVPVANGNGGRTSTRGRTEARLEPDGDLPEWEVVRRVDEEVSVGDAVRFTKTLTEADVERFAAASGDTNPIHLDEDWAEETRFRGRIVHGTLVSGLISAAIARLPGGIIYLSQDVEFQAPVRLGDRVTADVRVVEDLGGGRFRLRTRVLHDDAAVIDGEAVVLVDEEPDVDPGE
jgi:acyl dehydratase